MTTPTPLLSHPAVAEFLALDDERVKGDWDKLTSQATYFAKLTPWLIVASKIAPEVRRLVERCDSLTIELIDHASKHGIAAAERDCMAAELTQSRAEVEKLRGRVGSGGYCAFCEQTVPAVPGFMLAWVMRTHVEQCDKHPLFQARAELTALRKERGDLREALRRAWATGYSIHRDQETKLEKDSAYDYCSMSPSNMCSRDGGIGPCIYCGKVR